MTQSSLTILNGTHKIYRRLISQIPTQFSRTLDLRSMRARFSVVERALVASVMVRGQVYLLRIAKLINEKEFRWIPHSELVDKSEAAVMTEMLLEFKENNNSDSLKRGNQALCSHCDSFFRKNYR